jgi:TIR domain
MRKVFISYSRQNKRDVDQLVEHLRVLGCDTWHDSSLHGGQDWWEEILRRIADCDTFIAIISRDSLNSTACRRELDWAESLEKPVLPVAVEPSPKALPRRFSIRQIVDYSDRDSRDRAALTLGGGLATLPGAPPLPDPLPKPPAAPLSYLTDLIELVSQPDALDHDQQRYILSQLEPALRSVDREERRGGRDILELLSSRDDLYADVDRTIIRLRSIGDVAASVRSDDQGATPVLPPSGSGTDADLASTPGASGREQTTQEGMAAWDSTEAAHKSPEHEAPAVPEDSREAAAAVLPSTDTASLAGRSDAPTSGSAATRSVLTEASSVSAPAHVLEPEVTQSVGPTPPAEKVARPWIDKTSSTPPEKTTTAPTETEGQRIPEPSRTGKRRLPVLILAITGVLVVTVVVLLAVLFWPSTPQGVITDTCDEGGSCGVKQRIAPRIEAQSLNGTNPLKDGTTVAVVCQTSGDIGSNRGHGNSPLWYKLSNGAYVNSVYVNIQASGPIPAC